MKALTLSIFCLLSLTACSSLPEPYKIDIPQGNIIDQAMIDRIKPGMSKSQVQYLLGTPMLADVFHRDRWDYVFSNQSGSHERTEKQLTIFFQNDQVVQVTGDYLPAQAEIK